MCTIVELLIRTFDYEATFELGIGLYIIQSFLNFTSLKRVFPHHSKLLLGLGNSLLYILIILSNWL